MHRILSDSVRIAFLDRAAAVDELRQHADRLVEQDRSVLVVGLFGSLARGESTPSSDADVLVVLSSHHEKRWFDRIPQYADAFSGTFLPVEPFPFLLSEIRNMLKCAGFMQTLIREVSFLAGNREILSGLKKCFRQADE